MMIGGEIYKGYRCEHCLAHFAYGDSLDRHRARCPATAKLAAEVAELRRRIRRAKRMLLKVAGPIVTGTTAWRLLDLRRPLKAVRHG